MANWLLAHGAATDAKDYSGKTALECAAAAKQTEMAEAISKASAMKAVAV